MKRLSFAALFILAGFVTKLNAQTEKGIYLLGGGATLTSGSGTTTFMIDPNVGIFVIKNIAVGAELAININNGSNPWALGPFVRAYFGGDEKGKFFGHGAVNVSGAKGSKTAGGFGLGVGYALFLNQSIAIDIKANLRKAGSSKSFFVLGAGFQIHLD